MCVRGYRAGPIARSHSEVLERGTTRDVRAHVLRPRPPSRPRSPRPVALVAQILVNERDRHAAFADRRRDTLDRAETHVAAGEDARNAGFEKIGIAIARPAAGF